MKNSTLRAALDLVGAGTVLVGLVFVGYELRQNTAAVQASSFQSYTDATIDWLSHVVSDPGLADIWQRFVAGSELDDVERMRATLLVRMQWFRYQDAYSQWQRGSLSASDWAVSRDQICRAPGPAPERVPGGASPGLVAKMRRETWPEHRPYFTEEFVSFVEDCWASEDGP